MNSNWQCHKNYTQNDWFREGYIDTSAGDWSFRLGKQQVVWGTADGIKLLDIINPTDFREMAQNAMEDSRIPIWMINAERNIGETGNVQFILSENRKNVIPGLNDDNRNFDSGHPFIMKGVDSITGRVNGFLHVTPALAAVAGSFNMAAYGGMFTGGEIVSSGLLLFADMTVDGFASRTWSTAELPIPQDMPGYFILNDIAQNGLPGAVGLNANNRKTNLMAIYGPQVTQVKWKPSNATSAFEYMPNATFATFNTFTVANPNGTITGAKAVYKEDDPSAWNPNAGLRYRMSLDNGLNFGVNYFYHYSANPEINMSWHDSQKGERLKVLRARGMYVGDDQAGNPIFMPNPGDTLSKNQVGNNAMYDPTDPTMSFLDAMHTILLQNKAGQFYGAFDPTTGGFNTNTHGVTMRMTETRNRVNSIGGSFDYGTEWGSVPVVIRGELLYDIGEKQPVVDKRLLGIGDLTNALTMEDMDKFSYVIGLDITVMTNLLISGQFIQMNNLDFVDDSRTCTTQTGLKYDCSRYTGRTTSSKSPPPPATPEPA